MTSGGAPVYIWPGGGITFMVDVTTMPDNAFGHVPTPALVAPIEFTLPLASYENMGGHTDDVIGLEAAMAAQGNHVKTMPWDETHPWPARRKEQ